MCCIDVLTFCIDLSTCESSGRGDGLRVCSPKVIKSNFGKRHIFLKSAPLAGCVLHYRLMLLANIAHTFASSQMENTMNQLEPVGIICISDIWTDDHMCLLKHAVKCWSFSCFFWKGFSQEAVKQIWQER